MFNGYWRECTIIADLSRLDQSEARIYRGHPVWLDIPSNRKPLSLTWPPFRRQHVPRQRNSIHERKFIYFLKHYEKLCCLLVMSTMNIKHGRRWNSTDNREHSMNSLLTAAR